MLMLITNYNQHSYLHYLLCNCFIFYIGIVPPGLGCVKQLGIQPQTSNLQISVLPITLKGAIGELLHHRVEVKYGNQK